MHLDACDGKQCLMSHQLGLGHEAVAGDFVNYNPHLYDNRVPSDNVYFTHNLPHLVRWWRNKSDRKEVYGVGKEHGSCAFFIWELNGVDCITFGEGLWGYGHEGLGHCPEPIRIVRKWRVDTNGQGDPALYTLFM